MFSFEVLAALDGFAAHELLEDALLAPRDGVVADLVVVALQDGHAVGPAEAEEICLDISGFGVSLWYRGGQRFRDYSCGCLWSQDGSLTQPMACFFDHCCSDI